MRRHVHGGRVAAVEQIEVLVPWTIEGQMSGFEGRISELRRTGCVVKVGTGENEALLNLVEEQDSVGE